MAINKKSFRKITVDDEVYYWKVSPDQWMLNLYITRGDNAFSNFKTSFEQKQISNYNDPAGPRSELVIGPKLVRHAIEYALKNGWNPNERGKDISMIMPDEIRYLRKIQPIKTVK